MLDKQERRLKKIKISIMRNPKFAFWGSIMMVGTTSVSDTCPTAATNGRDEIYGRKFIDSLDDKELAFVVLHENMHKAYRHLFTWRKLNDENPKLANAACDYVINLQLRDLDPTQSFIAMPMKDNKHMGLIDEKYRGLNAKQVFDLLKQEEEEGGDGGEGGDEGGGGFDEHDWDGAKELSQEEQEHLEREIDRAVRSGAIASNRVGEGGGGMTRELDEMLEPQVDWREQLREFVKATCANKDTSSWRRPNRRFLSMDTYMPSMIGEKVGHIAIGRDTSGSMGGAELSASVAETKGIAQEVSPERIDLIDWDGIVEKHEQLEGTAVASVDTSELRGGGGTDPRCMAKYLKDNGIKPECVIMLTDGYIDDWGTEDEWQGVPVLWAIVGGNKVVAPIGKTIHVRG
jgi:predicted metal-dependent peptidase